MTTDSPEQTAHQHFIDWMKGIGMSLILIGHVQGSPDALFNAVSAPVYSKQLGVAFFIFVAGWGLAKAHRPRRQEAFNRLFAIMLYGVACAVLMSVLAMLSKGTLNLSNYLPFALGANVFYNNFPANPTTWYIGMYLHLILLWWWLMPRQFSLLYLLPIAGLEWLLRAWLLDLGRPFTAYMLISNWLLVFLLGYILARHGDALNPLRGALLLVAWLVLLGLWQASSSPVGFDASFPTRLPGGGFRSALFVSALVTAVYVVNTLLAFLTFRSFRAPFLVRFIARNTLLIFILHMPLIYALAPLVYPIVEPVWLKKLLLLLVVVFILGSSSELINRVLPLGRLQKRVWQLLPHSASPPTA